MYFSGRISPTRHVFGVEIGVALDGFGLYRVQNDQRAISSIWDGLEGPDPSISTSFFDFSISKKICKKSIEKSTYIYIYIYIYISMFFMKQ